GADTPTGVCPSLHVGYSLAILSAWLKREESRSWWKAVLTAWVLLISISVCFVKQHSFTDVWAAGIMCALIEMVMFRRYWKERLLGLKAKLTAKEITEG
ncbi:MAG: phosphatase PAP2 family protein, partial [Lachnospiraceae bacterium]|nr:phosphatase PAP2 family protein [Lachnospiraceae bacterium]